MGAYNLMIFDRSQLRVSALLLGTVVSSLPILFFKYFPSQDGPSHLLNSKILFEYARPDNLYRDYYQLNLKVFPNWLFYAFSYLLAPFFDYRTIEGIFLALYLAVFTFGFAYFIHTTNKTSAFLTPIGVLMAYNYYLMMGFYNFCISLALFLWAFAFWWKHKENLDFPKLFILNIFLLSLYFSHLIPWLMMFYALGVYFLIRRQIWSGLKTFVALSPTVFLFLIYMSEYGRHGLEFHPILWLVRDLVVVRSLVSLGYYDALVGFALFLILVVLLLLTARQSLTRMRDSQLTVSFCNEEGLFFAILTVSTTFIYFFSPSAMGTGKFINERLLFFVILFLLPCIHIEIESRRRKIALLIISLCIARFVGVWSSFEHLNKELTLLTAGTAQVEYGKKSLSINKRALINDNSFYYRPFLHADNLYHLEKGLVSPDNYAARENYFPIKFRKDLVLTRHSELRPICPQMKTLLFYDYLLYYLGPDDDIAHCVLNNFEMIFRNEKMAVFKNQSSLKSEYLG